MVHRGRDGCILLDPWARVLLPLAPDIEAAAGLSHALGQAADGDSNSLGYNRAAEPLTKAERYGLLLLLRREPAPCLGRAVH